MGTPTQRNTEHPYNTLEVVSDRLGNDSLTGPGRPGRPARPVLALEDRVQRTGATTIDPRWQLWRATFRQMA
jgi:hypothetical protein